MFHYPSPLPSLQHPKGNLSAQSCHSAAKVRLQRWLPTPLATSGHQVVGNRSLASSQMGEFPDAVSQDQREKPISVML